MKETCGKRFILNGELTDSGMFDDSLVFRGDSIYEVIRLAGGIPYFFNDHMERLSASLRLQGRPPLANSARLAHDIIRLSKEERRKEINIKIVFNYHEDSTNYLIYYIDSIYPSQEQYRIGVKGILFYAERQDPGSKVINYRLRSSVHQELANENAYEALLVNGDNLITEGSRSNVFFVKEETLITAPDELILKGITRSYILGICNEKGIKVSFNCADADEIGRHESVFITGTSPMVLPLCCIGEQHFNPGNHLIAYLRDEYVQKAEASITVFREEYGKI